MFPLNTSDNAVYDLPKRARDYEIPHPGNPQADVDTKVVPHPEFQEEPNLYSLMESSEMDSNMYASLQDETKLYSNDQGQSFEMQVRTQVMSCTNVNKLISMLL